MPSTPTSAALQIRQATLPDAAAIALAASATFLETYAHVIGVDDIVAHVARNHSAKSYIAYLVNPACRIWVVQTATGAIVGYAVLAPATLPDDYPHPDDLEVTRIYVLSRFQNTGVGHSLMKQAFAEATQRNARQLVLGVLRANEKALAFYARHGFEQIGERRFQVGSAVFDDLVLGKTLGGNMASFIDGLGQPPGIEDVEFETTPMVGHPRAADFN